MICSYEVFDMMKHSKKALLSLTALAASAVVLFSGCADEAASSSTAPAAGSETTLRLPHRPAPKARNCSLP